MIKKIFFFGTVCLTALSFIIRCKPPQREAVQRVVPVEIYVARPDSLSSFISLTGGIEARNDAFVYSKVSEKLVLLKVQPGDRVKTGQILAVQYNKSALQGKTAAAAALRSTEIQLQARKDDFNRMNNLFAKKAVTRQLLDQAKTQLDIAVASLEQVSAALEQAAVLYENTVFHAPFDGRVAMVYFDLNEMVPAGQRVIKIVNANTVKATLNVPSIDIRKIEVGKQVAAVFPSFPDTQFNGVVYRMDEALDPATRTLAVEVRLSNTGNLLKSGIFGEFKIETARHTKAVVVSELTVMNRTQIITNEQGVQTERPEYYVYCAKSGKAEKRIVTPGIFSGGFTELSGDVSFGDSIIVVGHTIIKEGDTIRVVSRTEH